MELRHPKLGLLVATVQRIPGKTPCQVIDEQRSCIQRMRNHVANINFTGSLAWEDASIDLILEADALLKSPLPMSEENNINHER